MIFFTKDGILNSMLFYMEPFVIFAFLLFFVLLGISGRGLDWRCAATWGFMLVFILFVVASLINIEAFDWQCPSTIGKCPAGCEPQTDENYKCGKKLLFAGPGKCAKACPYICKDEDVCVNNECCKNCGLSNVPASCGL